MRFHSLARRSRAGLVAFVVREIADALGTFAIAPANPFASGPQLVRNVMHLPAFFALRCSDSTAVPSARPAFPQSPGQ